MRLVYRSATDDDLELLWRINSAGLGKVVREEFNVSDRQHREFFERHFSVSDDLQIIVAEGDDAGYLAHERQEDHVRRLVAGVFSPVVECSRRLVGSLEVDG